jgi:hypothetical protein
MPLVTLTLRSGKNASFKTAVLAAVHDALVNSGAPPADRFHRVPELSADDFRFDPNYPDLIDSLRQSPGLDPDNVMLVFRETLWENWSFGGGRFIHV